MPALILRLLTLVALVLMPFGMGTAIAAPVYHAPASVSAAHCEDERREPVDQSTEQAIDCAMACSMVATAETGVDEPSPDLRLVMARPLAERGSDLHPDTATPPPKLF